ncbi:MAG: hypothetical protein F6K24_05900 [Okeania sp. SIO2D1]|nr:hypothetical protein [Okeania sp. SIO2D1]
MADEFVDEMVVNFVDSDGTPQEVLIDVSEYFVGCRQISKVDSFLEVDCEGLVITDFVSLEEFFIKLTPVIVRGFLFILFWLVMHVLWSSIPVEF